jgi:hypothetical protein
MRSKLKYILALMLILSICFSVAAQQGNEGSSEIKPRTPTQEQIDSYTKQNDFNYKEEEIVADSWLDRVLMWIERKLDELFSNQPSAVITRYLIMGGLIVFLVLSLMKVKLHTLFFKNKAKNTAGFEIEELSLLQTDLEDLANKEIQKKNYPAALRYLFLKLLKQLDEKEIIKLGIHKTNLEYQYEMKSSEYKTDFSKLRTVFEFVWYGKFSIEEPMFSNVHEEFKNVYRKLNA